jgi:hypothetical protein
MMIFLEEVPDLPAARSERPRVAGQKVVYGPVAELWPPESAHVKQPGRKGDAQ